MFGVFHKYYVDGGFGDAVSKVALVAVFEDEKLATKFVLDYANPHDDYMGFSKGTLTICNLDDFLITKDNYEDVKINFRPFWKKKDAFDNDHSLVGMKERMTREENKRKEQEQRDAAIAKVYKVGNDSRIAYWDSNN